MGVTAYGEARYADAIEAFLAADRLRPSAAQAFNIAKSYEALGDVSHALASYREYLHRAQHAADRKAVEARVSALARRLSERGVQQVSLRASPNGAVVHVDDEPVGTAPVVIDLRPGLHRVIFRSPEHENVELEFELFATQPLDLSTTLPAKRTAGSARPVAIAVTEREPIPSNAPRSAAAEHAGPARANEPSSPRTTARTLGFVALGASVAALGAAVTAEIMRSSSENAARQETEQVRFSRAYEQMKSRQTVARVLAGAGGVLAAVGGVLLVAASGSSVERKSREGLALACAPAKCHATYSAAF